MNNTHLTNLLVEYAANSIESSEVLKQFNVECEDSGMILLREFTQAWEAAPCDNEGPTQEQDKYLDAILEEYTEALLDV